MVEFDVDMGYLLEEQSLDRVVLNDENGEYEPIEFVTKLNCIHNKVHVSEEAMLNEAIAKAKASEDWQLAEWLRATRGSFDSARWFTRKMDELKAENKQLRELVRELYEDQCAECDRWKYHDRVHKLGIDE